MFSIGIGVKIEVWRGDPQRCLSYKRKYLMRGIRFEIYPIKGVIHAFQTPFVVQEHQEKKNPKDKLLLVDLGNSSSSKYVNNRMSDYNKYTNLPLCTNQVCGK